MYYDYFDYYNKTSQSEKKVYIIDFKQSDVTGDGILDNIYLVGTKSSGTDSPLVGDIALIVQDGITGSYTKVSLKENSGYNPTMFIGDFTGDRINDILVSIDSGGSGAIGYYYVYSFVNNSPKKLFDFEKFNQEYEYEVNYKDNYIVEVISKKLNTRYMIDIRYKGKEYLSEIYDENGKLKEPIEGWVDPISGLYPVDFQRDGIYELYTFQRISGRYHADALGYVQTSLEWDKSKFTPFFQQISIYGEEMN